MEQSKEVVGTKESHFLSRINKDSASCPSAPFTQRTELLRALGPNEICGPSWFAETFPQDAFVRPMKRYASECPGCRHILYCCLKLLAFAFVFEPFFNFYMQFLSMVVANQNYLFLPAIP